MSTKQTGLLWCHLWYHLANFGWHDWCPADSTFPSISEILRLYNTHFPKREISVKGRAPRIWYMRTIGRLRGLTPPPPFQPAVVFFFKIIVFRPFLSEIWKNCDFTPLFFIILGENTEFSPPPFFQSCRKWGQSVVSQPCGAYPLYLLPTPPHSHPHPTPISNYVAFKYFYINLVILVSTIALCPCWVY